MDYSVHNTAIVDEGARIGRGSRVWHWVHVCGGAAIGEDCVLGQNVFVGGFYGEMYFSGFRVDQRRLSASEIESLANQTGPYMNKGVHRIAQ